MEQKSDKKGLAERVLGGKPTRHQEFVFRLMVMSLVLWPLFFFMSLFIFDAPVRTTVDEISRWGATLTISLGSDADHMALSCLFVSTDETLLPTVPISEGEMAFLSLSLDSICRFFSVHDR